MNDDEVMTSPGAREAAHMAQIEAGLIPGIQRVPVNSDEDEKKLFEELSTEERRICFVEVLKESIDKGLEYSEFLAKFPQESKGQVVISFTGWADDPRELYDIPEAVMFCRKLLFGANTSVEDKKERARQILSMLIDEQNYVETMGNAAYDIAGRLWIVTMVYQKETLMRHANGAKRAIHTAKTICNYLMS